MTDIHNNEQIINDLLLSSEKISERMNRRRPANNEDDNKIENSEHLSENKNENENEKENKSQNNNNNNSSSTIGATKSCTKKIDHNENTVNDASGTNNDKDKDIEEKVLTPEEIKSQIEKANNFKADGNLKYGMGELDEAIKCYSQAIRFCPKEHNNLSIYYANRAACYYKLEEHEKVIEDCDQALKVNDQYMKALLRRASSYEKIEKYKEALNDYETILTIEPGNSIALVNKQSLPNKIKDQEEKMKEEMMTKLKDLGNSFLGNFGMSLNNFQTQQKPDGSYSMNFNPSP